PVWTRFIPECLRGEWIFRQRCLVDCVRGKLESRSLDETARVCTGEGRRRHVLVYAWLLQLSERDGDLHGEQARFVHAPAKPGHPRVHPHPALEHRHRLIELRCDSDPLLTAHSVAIPVGGVCPAVTHFGHWLAEVVVTLTEHTLIRMLLACADGGR